MALIEIDSPSSPECMRKLHAGDKVSISGTIVTARDQVHKYLAAGGEPPINLEGTIIYHCGPVTVRNDDTWTITAAGPTTSIREEPYEADIIRKHHISAVMGKGGMGARTLGAMSECGCTYLHMTGGAARYIARCIKKVRSVHLEEFGLPEAMWVLEVENLPALVTMDSHNVSLHEKIASQSGRRFNTLMK